MRMKKLFVWGATGVLLAGMTVMPVSAHGHHYARTTVAEDAVCELCTVEDCTETGLHYHDEELYCGYDHECGYCDRSCVTIREKVQTRTAGSGSCHGRGHHGHHR